MGKGYEPTDNVAVGRHVKLDEGVAPQGYTRGDIHIYVYLAL